MFVTHDQAEALAMADLVAVMERGRLRQVGPPEELFERPADCFVAGFVGRSARFRAVVERPGLLRAAGVALAADDTPPAGPVEVFLRPHRVVLGADGPLPARVLARTYEGATALLTLDTPLGSLLAAPSVLLIAVALAVVLLVERAAGLTRTLSRE